jgi:hypothetical protein
MDLELATSIMTYSTQNKLAEGKSASHSSGKDSKHDRSAEKEQEKQTKAEKNNAIAEEQGVSASRGWGRMTQNVNPDLGRTDRQYKYKKIKYEKYKREIEAAELLHTNNCLINAIAISGRGDRHEATEAELIQIRSELENVGEMMSATPKTVTVILNALGLENRGLTVTYRHITHSGLSIPDDIVIRGVEPINIIHNGRDHFQPSETSSTSETSSRRHRSKSSSGVRSNHKDPQQAAKVRAVTWEAFVKQAAIDHRKGLFWREALKEVIYDEDKGFVAFVGEPEKYFGDTLSEVSQDSLENLAKFESLYNQYLKTLLDNEDKHSEKMLFGKIAYFRVKIQLEKLYERAIECFKSLSNAAGDASVGKRLNRAGIMLSNMIEQRQVVGQRKFGLSRSQPVPESLIRGKSLSITTANFAGIQGPGPESTPSGALHNITDIGHRTSVAVGQSFHHGFNVDDFPSNPVTSELDTVVGGIGGSIATLAASVTNIHAAREVLKNENSTKAERDAAQETIRDEMLEIGKASYTLAEGLAKAVGSGLSIAKNIGDISDKVYKATTAFQVAEGAQGFAAPFTIATNLLQFSINTTKTVLSGRQYYRLEKLSSAVEKDLQVYLAYAARKKRTKLFKSASASLQFGLATAAGGVGLAILLGASVIPVVGWSLAAGAALVGIGLATYKLGRSLYKYRIRTNNAKKLLDHLILHDTEAIEFFAVQLNMSPILALQEIRSGNAGKMKVEAKVYEHLRHKRERMAIGLQLALAEGTDSEKEQARQILDSLGFKKKDIDSLKESGGEKRILSKLESY